MKKSMLDALAQEQSEILKLVSEASRLTAEATRRCIALRDQLAFLALEDRMSPEEAENQFQDFVDRNFSVGNGGVEIENTPGFHPQAQDSEEGNQGSGDAAPGGAARAYEKAQPEQAVAEAASVERALARNDTEAVPDGHPDLLILDPVHFRAAYDGRDLALTGRELRLLRLLNSQVPIPTQQILEYLPLRRKEALIDLVFPLNKRLKEIDVLVIQIIGDFFQLQPLQHN